jgi:hypothetical protein
MKVKNLLKITETVEDYLKLFVTFFFFTWNVIEGAVFQNEYPRLFVKLYPIAAWRLLLLIALIVGAMWDPFVGIMLAFATFFYVMDMEVTMEKWKR